MFKGKRHIYKYLLVIIAFSVFLILLTPIVLHCFKMENDINKISENDISSDNMYLYYGIDKSMAVDGLFEQYYLEGWVFTEDDNAVISEMQATYANRDKQINVYFKDIHSGALYQVKTDVISRLDIFRSFSPNVKVNGMYHGFVSSFSTIELPEGKYQVILESIENEECRGKMEVAMFFQKEGHTLRAISSPNLNLPNDISCDNSVMWGIDGYSFGSGNMAVSGWSFNNKYETINIKEDTTYIRLISENGFGDYATNFGQKRTDIAEYFGSGYSYCGFTVDIAMSEIAKYVENGLLRVKLVTKNNGQWHTTEEVSIEVDDELLEAYVSTDIDVVSSLDTEVSSNTETSNFSIIDIVAIPLTTLMMICHKLLNNYGLTILVFTMLSKILLLPVSMWVHKNGIIMVKITPELNRVKIDHYGDRDAIDDATQALYKREKYSPLAGTVPMIVQIVMLLGVIGAVKNLLSGAESMLTMIPSEAGGVTWLMPLAAGAAALALGLAQNKLSPLQREQSKKEQWMSNGFSIAISLFLGIFVSLGVGVYWVASNLLTIVQQMLLNVLIKPEKYIDYKALEESKKELAELDSLSNEVSKEDKKREQEDYKRFFSVANKHLVFYSEKSGFYKYFKNVIESLLVRSNVIIHYVTSDPNDQIFQIAETQPRIRAYYIGEKKLITLMMKMDADIVVMTMPDLNNFHIKRSMVRNDVEYIYMFHGAIAGMRLLRPGAVDHFDTIFAVGSYIENEIRLLEEMNNTPKKKFVHCGYGVIEDMAIAYEKMKAGHAGHKTPYVLIAPSWQQDNILESCLVPLAQSLLNRGYDVVVRPHPQYLKRFPQKYAMIQNACKDLPAEHFKFEEDFSSNETVFLADLLVTDWSTIGYEYVLSTKKPVMFIDTPMKTVNPQCRELEDKQEPLDITLRNVVGISIVPESVEEKAGAAADHLIGNQAFYEATIEKVRLEHIYNFGESGKHGASYIIRSLIEKQNAKNQTV